MSAYKVYNQIKKLDYSFSMLINVLADSLEIYKKIQKTLLKM
jgi:hypothetical protein